MAAPRLRQICLVSERLEPVSADLAALFGLSACYRDPHLIRYGLGNILFPVDRVLLEIVAPVQEGTAAGRFLARNEGRGGYMAIFSAPDHAARAQAANAHGVRTAHTISHPPYHGVQLHPRDCRAAFIEFNHTDGTDDVTGAYPPAGPDWESHIRTAVTRRLSGFELQSPDPPVLARHWARILDAPLDGNAIVLPNAQIRVVPGARELLSAIDLEVADPEAVRHAASRRGYLQDDEGIAIAGVTMRLHAPNRARAGAVQGV